MGIAKRASNKITVKAVLDPINSEDEGGYSIKDSHNDSKQNLLDTNKTKQGTNIAVD